MPPKKILLLLLTSINHHMSLNEERHQLHKGLGEADGVQGAADRLAKAVDQGDGAGDARAENGANQQVNVGSGAGYAA